MSYLLDVNSLVALGHAAHVHHRRVQAWVRKLRPTDGPLLTCSITELGFIRVSVQARLQIAVLSAREALSRLKSSSPIRFELSGDSLGADQLPIFVTRPDQISDGHLLELAKSIGAELATLDAGISGAFFIPLDGASREPEVQEARGAYGSKKRRFPTPRHPKNK